jgi:hypothetical protein
LLKNNAKELIEKAIEMAKDGDGPALRLCIERLAPARKDRPVWFDLPEMEEAKDAVNASAAIVAIRRCFKHDCAGRILQSGRTDGGSLLMPVRHPSMLCAHAAPMGTTQSRRFDP